MSIINSASTKVTSRVFVKNQHPFGGQPQSAIALTVSSALKEPIGNSKMGDWQ
jgi:hypothetical protein